MFYFSLLTFFFYIYWHSILATALVAHKTELLALRNVYRSVLLNSTDIPCTGSGLTIFLASYMKTKSNSFVPVDVDVNMERDNYTDLIHERAGLRTGWVAHDIYYCASGGQRKLDLLLLPYIAVNSSSNWSS